jgi:hypothetical protein
MRSEPARSVTYSDWTRAIGKHFFRNQLGDAVIYLAFDEAAAVQIGRSFELGAADFIAAVASVINVDDADNPFFYAGLTQCGDEFPYLGIMAAQVYVATAMGSFANLEASAYWSPFQQLFTGGQALPIKALEKIDEFWTDARDFYQNRHRGRLAVQNDPRNVPHVGWRHINLPLWQALLRECDRTQIRQWLRDRRTEIGAAEALRELVDDAEHFNRKLAQTLHDTIRNAALAAALEVLIAELLAGLGHGANSQTRTMPGRLRLVGRSNLACALQRRGASDEWVDAVSSLETEDVRQGLRDELSGTTWRGDDRILFVDAGQFVGFTSTRGAIAPGATVTLIFVADDASVVKHLESARWKSLNLDPRLEGLVAARLDITEDDEPLLAQFGCRLPSDRAIGLEGGLKYLGRYLGSRPPRVRVAVASNPVRLNEKVLPVGADGYCDLPTPLAPGRYKVEAANDALHFDVEDGASLDDSPDGDEICVALSRYGLMQTSRVDSLPTSEFLVGAYLGFAPE